MQATCKTRVPCDTHQAKGTMLYEIKNIRQYKDEPERRWFYDREVDLTVWFNKTNEIVGFQLCYDKTQNQHALTWYEDSGYQHNRVDDGESIGSIGRFKGTPILFRDGNFDGQRISDIFAQKSQDIPRQISVFVSDRIASFR